MSILCMTYYISGFELLVLKADAVSFLCKELELSH